MFAYLCPNCGLVDFPAPMDKIHCRCGRVAKRRYSVNINRSSLKQSGRWDPVVGEYVANDRQFRSLLAQGQDAQAEKLGMDVKLQTVDARDTDALDSLHGRDPAERQEMADKAKVIR
jgi:hypothetical protein